MQPLSEYPRPSLVRENYTNLNGKWKYAIRSTDKKPYGWDGEILVPYSPETKSSGVNKTLLPDQWLHYSRKINIPNTMDRILLHFGAVDDFCRIIVNDKVVGEHWGGYLPFTIDITEALKPGENEILVTISDPSDTGDQLRGKQTLNPGGMYYPAQSGIWQTVWMEQVPENYIKEIKYKTDIDSGKVNITIIAPNPDNAEITIYYEGKEIAKGKTDKKGHLNLTIPKDELYLWSPEHPALYDVKVKLPDGDTVTSYFAFRKVSLEPDSKGVLRVFLNNKPYFLHGLLDQGYWPDGLYTPPSDQAMLDDILTAKELGFNLLRKHAKVEPERWYYHCDKSGMIVWQDMVNGGGKYPSWFLTKLINMAQPALRRFPDKFYKFFARDNKKERTRYYEQLEDMVKTLDKHPSIIAWVPFNEGWGQFDAKKATSLLKKWDPTRLVDEASGWFDQGGGDFLSLHHYFYPPYIHQEKNRTVALTEYGGIAYPHPDHLYTDQIYGYGTAQSGEELSYRYNNLLMKTILPRIKKGLSALVYTQLSDVEDEVNGLLTYDREILKLDKETALKTSKALFNEFEKVSS